MKLHLDIPFSFDGTVVVVWMELIDRCSVCVYNCIVIVYKLNIDSWIQVNYYYKVLAKSCPYHKTTCNFYRQLCLAFKN